MDFRLTEQQIALRDSVREYLAEAHPPALLRRLESAGGRDPAVWDGLVAMGLPGLLVPESAGGLGLSLVEGALIAVELGRANVSGPLVDTALVAAPWLARRGDGAALTDIITGTYRVALAHGANPWIADLDQADAVLTASGLQTIQAASVPLSSVDPLRQLFAPLPDAGADDHMLNLAALMAAAQMLGAADRMLELATNYAKIRQQFGQPIGTFQAVKHMLASACVRVDFAKPVLLRAAYALDRNMPAAATHVSHAKLAATDAAMLTTETAIQVHGAMGYTYEVDLHFWMKRVWALAGAWGDRNFHQRRLEATVLGGTLPLGPGETFVSEENHA